MGVFVVEFNRQSHSPTTVEEGDVIVDKGRSTVTVRNIEAESAEDADKTAKPIAEAFLNELC